MTWVEIDYTRLPTMHYEYSATSIDELRKIEFFREEAICYLQSEDVNVFDEDMTKMYYNAFAQEDEVKDGDPVIIEEGHLRFTFTPTSITIHNEEYRTFLSAYEECTKKEKRNYWRNKIETDIEYVLDRLVTLEQK
jgi:hypothetical protein